MVSKKNHRHSDCPWLRGWRWVYFERVRIVNGEGYYNFYATNAQGSLFKERMIQRSRYTYLR